MIIYLHGFNSAFDPESEKVKELAKIGGIVPVSYDSFDTFENIIASLKEMADPLPVYEFAFAGTSLGGFFAAHISGVVSGVGPRALTLVIRGVASVGSGLVP